MMENDHDARLISGSSGKHYASQFLRHEYNFDNVKISIYYVQEICESFPNAI